MNINEPQTISLDVLKEKYCKDNEQTPDDVFRRVAKGLATNEKTETQAQWEEVFYNNMKAGAIGAGRIMSVIGSDVKATAINCFVQPVGDAISGYDADGYPGIYEALRESAETLRRGGGVGYDFSRVRPRGAFVNTTKSRSSGPCSYMNVFDMSCATVESAGLRRGAQMGVLRIDHPDVLEFITAKRTPGRWNNFNVSVNVSDAFMKCLEADGEWELVHKAEPSQYVIDEGAYRRKDGLWVYKKIKASKIWDTIMKSTYDFAEPGILFLDNANKDNNLTKLETIEATNPCGEQPLPPYACCDLGPINLTKFVVQPFKEDAYFDYDAFKKAVTIQVRVLDNVLDITLWPLEKQALEGQNKRRIGIGFTGLGNALAMLRIRYNSEEALMTAARISEEMRNTAYSASVDLAIEKGPFAYFDKELYFTEDNFASRLPEDIKERINEHGIRNSHLLSIAPTGTVSLAFCDNASNGIEPAFSWGYKRRKRNGEGGWDEYMVEDHAFRVYRETIDPTVKVEADGSVKGLPDYFVNALEMSADDHMRMMEVVQPFIDTAISKTVNIPADYPFEDFKSLYYKAWKAKLKGLATYRPNDTLGSVLVAPAATEKKPEVPAKQPDTTVEDPMKTVIERRPKGSLNAVTDKIEYYTNEGQQRVYLITSFVPVTMPDGSEKERAIEFFMPVGQSSESQQWITATMRSLSLAARGGFLDRALEDLRKVRWDRGPIRYGMFVKADGTMRPMWHDSEVALLAYAIQETIKNRDVDKVTFNLDGEVDTTADADESTTMITMAGKKCNQCGAHAVIKKDGCDMCTACGEIGSCG